MVSIEFSVPDLPPNNKNRRSMWGVESQVEKIIQLRMCALIALQEAGFDKPFNSNIYLSLNIRAPEERIENSIDLDNMVSGVCDALGSSPDNPGMHVHESFLNPDIEDIHPKNPILYYDDNQIYGLTATKTVDETTSYTVILKTELENETGALTYNEIIHWSKKYDLDHIWWTVEEERVGKQIRRDNLFGLGILKEIIHWKFLTLPGREKITIDRISQYTDSDIRKITKNAFLETTDKTRIKALRQIKGVGVALASTILTFYRPQDYCVYDIHVMNGFYGEKPNNMFATDKHYLKLLEDMRMISTRENLPVRTIEKAYFKREFGK